MVGAIMKSVNEVWVRVLTHISAYVHMYTCGNFTYDGSKAFAHHFLSELRVSRQATICVSLLDADYGMICFMEQTQNN